MLLKVKSTLLQLKYIKKKKYIYNINVNKITRVWFLSVQRGGGYNSFHPPMAAPDIYFLEEKN